MAPSPARLEMRVDEPAAATQVALRPDRAAGAGARRDAVSRGAVRARPKQVVPPGTTAALRRPLCQTRSAALLQDRRSFTGSRETRSALEKREHRARIWKASCLLESSLRSSLTEVRNARKEPKVRLAGRCPVAVLPTASPNPLHTALIWRSSSLKNGQNIFSHCPCSKANFNGFSINITETIGRDSEVTSEKSFINRQCTTLPDVVDGVWKNRRINASLDPLCGFYPVHDRIAEQLDHEGRLLLKQGNLLGALRAFEEAIANRPAYAPAYNNQGLVLVRLGRCDEAIASFRETLRLEPHWHQAYANLGVLLAGAGRTNEAIGNLRTAAELNPKSPEILNNLANALAASGNLDESIACAQRSLAIEPVNAEALNALGNALKDQGCLDEAIACYSRAAGIRPELPLLLSNWVYALHFHPDQNQRSLLAAAHFWRTRHADHLTQHARPHLNDRNAHRRIRIGYVSPDFREHPVARFLLPLLQGHDRKCFEVFCYSNVVAADEITEHVRELADAWRNILALTDAEAANLIRDDRIDILVDLTMHLRGNRLLVFARKAAPVQVSYLAYCSTTGLDAIDYRFTDPFLDPPGLNQACYSEQSIRLPDSYWCYRPSPAAPAVGPLPSSVIGSITFGCLNNFCKISAAALQAWAALLQAVPKSRLVLHAGEGSHRQRIRVLFAINGVEPHRVEFVGRQPLREYFERLGQIDIGLDPFPCTGGTTTCDALWMGVPVVSLAGQTAVSRGGLSILSNVGLGELVANNVDHYVETARALSRDTEKLQSLRDGLRRRMRVSVLMDEGRFVLNVETAYRGMWQRWCAAAGSARG